MGVGSLSCQRDEAQGKDRDPPEKWELAWFNETKSWGSETPFERTECFLPSLGPAVKDRIEKWPARHPTGDISMSVNDPVHPSYNLSWRFPGGGLPFPAIPPSSPPHLDCSWSKINEDPSPEGQKVTKRAKSIAITNRSRGVGAVHSLVCLFWYSGLSYILSWFQLWDPPASASLVLEWQMCATTLSLQYSFKSYEACCSADSRKSKVWSLFIYL